MNSAEDIERVAQSLDSMDHLDCVTAAQMMRVMAQQIELYRGANRTLVQAEVKKVEVSDLEAHDHRRFVRLVTAGLNAEDRFIDVMGEINPEPSTLDEVRRVIDLATEHLDCN